MSIIDTSITQLQVLALACTGIKSAPVYPTESGTVFPQVLAYISSGTGQADNATDVRLIFNVTVSAAFLVNNLRDTYAQINLFIPEYLKRLAGDPTLNSSVSTIVYPVQFSIVSSVFNNQPIEAVNFILPMKFKETPTVTA